MIAFSPNLYNIFWYIIKHLFNRRLSLKNPRIVPWFQKVFEIIKMNCYMKVPPSTYIIPIRADPPSRKQMLVTSVPFCQTPTHICVKTLSFSFSKSFFRYNHSCLIDICSETAFSMMNADDDFYSWKKRHA